MSIPTLALTGLRSQKLPFGYDEEHADCLRLKELIRKYIVKLIEQKNVHHFISGMALGSDQIFCHIVIELKKQYDDIKLEAAIPCKEQDKYWPESNRREYKRLLSLCDERYYVTNTPYTKGCMMLRNNYMVWKADYLLAVWDGSEGGTGKTIKIAWEKGIPILIINPVSFTVQWGKNDLSN